MRTRLHAPTAGLRQRCQRYLHALRSLGSLAAALSLLAVTLTLLGACTKKAPEGDRATAGAEHSVEPAAPAKIDLWKGVPPLEPQPTDYATELKPANEGPKPPPSVSERVELPFPPKAEAPKGPDSAPEPGPLEILRFSPEGEQSLVDAVSVAFNQPMVPLAAIDDLRELPVPLTIEPQPPGQFRWLGTQMVVFEPKGRMPFSTTYTARVKAGARSELGAALAKDKQWTFTTPSLALAWSSPSDRAEGQGLTPTIQLRFNQPIKRDALAAALTLKGGGKTVTLRSLPRAEWAERAPATDEEASRTLILQLGDGERLTPNTSYRLQIPAGVYGEGPNKSKAVSVGFKTYPPLTLRGPDCSRWDCHAGGGVNLHASTSVVGPTLEQRLTVEPPVEDLVVSGGSSPYLAGKFLGDTSYTVTVEPGVEDIHGQTLARKFTTRFKIPPLDPQLGLRVPGKNPAVLELSHSRILDLRVGGHKELELRARRFSAAELTTFLSASFQGDEYAWPYNAPEHQLEQKYDVRDSRKKIKRLGVDLTTLLPEAGSFAFLNIRSEPYQRWGYTQRDHFTQIVSRTDLGVSVALDHDSGVALVTSIERGEPVSGAQVELYKRNYDKPLWTGTTDARGLAEIEYRDSLSSPYMIVKAGGDVSYTPLQTDVQGRWRGYYGRYNDDDEPRVFFYTERTPYKPGDTVHLSGVLRKERKGPEGKVLPWKQNVTATYTVTGPRGHELTKGEVKVSAIGTFSVDIETEAAGDTGDYRFRLTVPGGLFGSDRTFWHSFPVETYRVPEFEVEVARPSSDPLMFGDTLEAEVLARYLHGAPLVGGEVSYTLSRQETGFTPPGAENQSYTFGRGSSYWGRGRGRGYYGGYGGHFGGSTKVLERGHGATNARGAYEIKRALKAVEYAEGVKPPNSAKQGEAPSKDADSETQDDPPAAATYSIESEVMDQNHQAIAGRGSFVVHPAAVYPGVRSERTVYKAGETARIEGVVVDLAGKRLEGKPLVITLQRSDTERKAVEKNGRWTFEYKTTTNEVGKCERRSKSAPTVCELPVEKAGNYTVRALSEDDEGRKNLSTMTLYVHGDDAVIWQEDQKTVDLVPQKREYKPGETATLLVRSPFQTARGLVVLEREGIVDYHPVTIEGGTATVSFPVTETMIPNLGVSAVVTRGRVEVAGAPPGQDLGRPSHASGHVELEVSKDPKKIAVTVTPERDAIAPGETLTVTLETKTVDGAPLPAAVAVFVVDEGVLSLMGYETPDPLGFFHRTRSAMVSLYDLRTFLLPKDETAEVTTPDKNKQLAQTIALNGFAAADEPMPEEEAAERSRGDMATGGGLSRNGGAKKKAKPRKSRAPGAPPPPAAAMPAVAESGALALDADKAMANDVKLRTMFATTAYFNPEVTTDENGVASLEIPMPENLTSFRVMAVAIDPAQDDRFGSGDSSVRVRKPIMLRPSLPRFANFGDKFEGSVMVDNQTDAPQAVLVGARGLNVKLTGETEQQVTIPAGESKEVRFPMETDLVGTMRLQFAALANGGRDATELELPVLYPATRQAFATYGATDSSVVQTIKPPTGALPGYGGLELSMSSTALNGLEDAVGFLVDYRYECTEQAASRLLPIFVLGPVLNEFPIAELKDLERRKALATAGIAKILSRQNGDGGFRYWDTRSRSSAYLTTWTTFALLEGKKAGFEVDEDALKRAKSYLRSYIVRGDKDYWGWYYSWTTRAFALWLLSREDQGADLFAKVYAHKGEMPLYARALLMSAAHKYGKTAERDAQLADFRARVKENARVVHFIESKSESAAEGLQLLMHSDVQTDAIALMALLEVAPEDPLLPKVMAGIMSERDPRKGGRWGTTHANAWALLSASRYFTTVEKTVPDYVARIWLDEQFAGQQEFRGRDMSVVDQSVPMRALLAGGDGDKTLLLAKEGPGKLYYRLGLRYAPADLKMKAEDQGFTVSRTYAPLALGDREPDPESVKHLPNGDWQIKVGTTVQVSLTVVARDRATFVVVDDPLPAGLEGQNARFDTTTRIDGANSSRRDRGDYGGLLGASGRSSRSSYWWHRWWRWSHTDLRDDRMLLFADRLPAGVYTHTYTARATTVGTFQLPPIHAEGMYTPEQFGHSASAVVHVVE